ncbi:hypothetical protein PTTG_28620 [Puccinia triticina 1-1 BBBD Race 1]|uniref:Trehalose-phosphatase n=1 Tax=Puccinia triticina (isolate 1-1 / race 1 (BBBD)) TaxID=630390 RepID=A0A180GAJ6_PUCT1|nr:hypothetical protein PTTG_28620 [Puccinia triticina 1-1 BBBD Race 1]
MLEKREVNTLPEVNYEKLATNYKESEQRLILLDYDGVLRPNRRYYIDQEDLEFTKALKKLAANPMNEVWIITARGQNMLPSFIRKIPMLNLGESSGTELQVQKGQVPFLEGLDLDMSEVDKKFRRFVNGSLPKFKLVYGN